MPDNSNQEKTEPATQRRLDDAREKGQVARSIEVNSVMIFIAALLYFVFWGKSMTDKLMEMMRHYFSFSTTFVLSADNMQAFMIDLLGQSLMILLPFLGMMMLVGVAANLLQIGFMFTASPLAPKFEKLNPFSGLKRIFSRRSFVELFKSIVKITIVTIVAWWAVRGSFESIMATAGQETLQIGIFTYNLIVSLLFKMILAMLLIAILDYGFQRWDFEDNLKMSKQEIKEEYKQFEGDPIIKSRIRSLQREMSRRRMLKAVPEAEVVITNPTHLAIALRYDMEKDPAPRVIARGADFIAKKIRETAVEHAIPIVENKPLAQALYKACDLNDLVPEDLYKAVAEVLAYVYKLKGKKVA